MDRHLFVLYFMLFLLLPFSARAGDSPSTVASTNELMKKVIGTIPDSNLKRGLKDYSEALGLERYSSDSAVGAFNAGVGAFFTRQYKDKRNSCVRDAAQKFYQDVGAYLKERNPCKGENEKYRRRDAPPPGSISYGCTSDDRAKLTEVAGEGRFDNQEPGWVWKLALKNANGDPNAALLLIGMCGHDDTNQGAYVALDKSAEGQDRAYLAIDDYRSKIKRIQAQIDELRAKKSDNSEDSYRISDLQYDLSETKIALEQIKRDGGQTVELNCPMSNTGYFAARSLDESADIPKDLKNELHEAFSGDGATKTASKYYHVYGSAFMACQLVQNGVSPSNAALIQQQAARVYRGIRMCQETQTKEKQSAERKIFEQTLSVKYNSKDPLTIAKKIIASREVMEGCDKIEPPRECRYLNMLGLPTFNMGSNAQFKLQDSDIQAKVNGAMKSMDAAELYKSWYLGGGKIAGQQLPCSDIRVLGPNDLKNPTESFFGRLSKPSDWTDERYQAATKKLSTWDADFKWTIAEHKAGADFAGKVCKKRAPGEKPLKGICPNGPPDGVTRYEGNGLTGPQQNQSKKSDGAPKSSPVKPSGAVK